MEIPQDSLFELRIELFSTWLNGGKWSENYQGLTAERMRRGRRLATGWGTTRVYIADALSDLLLSTGPMT